MSQPPLSPESSLPGQSLPPDQPPLNPQRANGLAVAALVCGIIGLFPLAAIFGFVALRQIRQHGDQGRGLALAGMALSGVWFVAGVVTLVVVLLTGNGTRMIFEVKNGECFVDVSADEDRIMMVDIVSCDDPHDGEMLARVEITEERYPGLDEVGDSLSQGCQAAAGAELKRSPIYSKLAMGSFAPTEEAWAQGVRAGMCAAVSRDESRLTAPIE